MKNFKITILINLVCLINKNKLDCNISLTNLIKTQLLSKQICQSYQSLTLLYLLGTVFWIKLKI